MAVGNMGTNQDTDNGADSGEGTPGLPIRNRSETLDGMLELLSNRRRRVFVEYLQSAPDEGGSISAATEYLLATQGSHPSEGRVHSEIRTELQHVHVPKLADVGIVDYDRRSGTVRYRSTERFDELFETIRAVEER